MHEDRMSRTLNALLNKGLDAGAYTGAAAACGDRRGVIAQAWIGALSPNGAPVNADTRWDMASVTKVMSTTMLALRALEDGALSLYDTLGMYLPDAPADKRGITMLQLMTHTAGFHPSFRLDRLGIRPEEARARILARPLDSAPGGPPVYSCMGFITLGFALEALYGRPLAELARDCVFNPLGMAHTGYNPAGGNIAATERDPATGELLCGVVHDENARFLGGAAGNAGVFSDLADMCTFSTMLARGGGGYLAPVTLARAITCWAYDSEERRGLGFQLAGTRANYTGELMPAASFGHNGFTGPSLAVDPTTGFWAVLLCNRVCPTRENNAIFPLRRRFHNALYASYSAVSRGEREDS